MGGPMGASYILHPRSYSFLTNSLNLFPLSS